MTAVFVYVSAAVQFLPGPEWSGWRTRYRDWSPCPEYPTKPPGGRVLTLVSAVRTWPDRTSDHLFVAGLMAARAVRLDPIGIPVWSTQSNLTDVLAQLERLPAPGVS
jgi:hypothetical protein